MEGNSARASLMEAIRKAGGKDQARLRSVLDRKQEAKRIKQVHFQSFFNSLLKIAFCL